MMKDGDDILLEAGEAAKYLAEKWEIPNYTTDAFKMLRRRHHLQPALLIGNASLWRKSDLDKIPQPKKGRPKKGGKDELDGANMYRCPQAQSGLAARLLTA
jgi:hypothetical protein